MDGGLVLQHRGAADLVLEQIGRERFTQPGGNFRVAFVQGPDGTASHLLVSAPRRLNVEFRRLLAR